MAPMNNRLKQIAAAGCIAELLSWLFVALVLLALAALSSVGYAL